MHSTLVQARRLDASTIITRMGRRLQEGLFLLTLTVALMGVLALVSFSPADPGWSYTGYAEQVENHVGRVGAWFADVVFYLVGLVSYLFPLMLAWVGWDVFYRARHNRPVYFYINLVRWFSFFLMTLSGSVFAAIQMNSLAPKLLMGGGGVLGGFFAGLLVPTLNPVGSSVLMLMLFLFGLTLFTGLSWFAVMDLLGEVTLWLLRRLLGTAPVPAAEPNSQPAPAVAPGGIDLSAPRKVEPTLKIDAIDQAADEQEAEVGAGFADLLQRMGSDLSGMVAQRPAAPAIVTSHIEPKISSIDDLLVDPGDSEPLDLPEFLREPTVESLSIQPQGPSLRELLQERQEQQKRIAEPQLPAQQALTQRAATETLPGLDLLDESPPFVGGYSPAALEQMSRLVEEKLKDYGVVAQVVAVHPGPVVTLFELQLAPGTKASKVTGLSNDLARSLSTVSVRVVEVIPGKTTIGIEIPNEKREIVYLRDIVSSPAYQDAKSLLTLSLGKDIGGDPVVADLGKMPHALIAGTTGSGKSVAINAMILSLLYKASPEEVRLIMVDPKMLELSVYEGIPHLLTPVVTDMKEASNALRWCVAEMERRYKLMATMGVRNIAGFNRKVEDAIAAGEPIKDPFFQPERLLAVDAEHPDLTKLPYIVVVIDELADMMMVVGKKVEELIARLAQKARAAGIHLLLATQRPSVDVITGLIKANIPTRMAFQVSSRIDSRTILDQMGAESLLGHGDGLYLAPGGSIPRRVHGAFVDDHEVHKVVEFLKKTGKPNYLDEILQEPTEMIPGLSPDAAGLDVEDADPLYDEAVQFVIESRRASISSVQRRLKIGYNRAARLIEEMERVGIVSPPEHNGNRQVLVASRED